MEVNFLAHLACGDLQRTSLTGVKSVVLFLPVILDMSIRQYRWVIRHIRPLTAKLQWFYSIPEVLTKVADSYMPQS